MARLWFLALALALACEGAANLEGKGCPCVLPYVCCPIQNLCLREGQACIDTGGWPITTAAAPPLSMEHATIYAFSQVDTNGAEKIDDEQLLDLAPDVVLRGWGQWSKYGTERVDYQFAYVDRCHDKGIQFVGGIATTAMLPLDLSRSGDGSDPEQLTSRNAENRALMRIGDDETQIYRASLANPAVRERLLKIGKLQIDGDQTHAGVDGLHFQEVNGGYQGANPDHSRDFVADGNEGFDQFHLADFNAYLLAKNPPGTDFAARYGMSSDNLLRGDRSPADLNNNFNYWKYLSRNGWSATPLVDANPLAAEWGRTTVNRPLPGGRTFVDSAEPYRYFRELVQELRAYASATQGRDLLITAQGTYPLVDFQSVGLDDYNTDGPGGTAVHYLPLIDTNDGPHLDGAKSLQNQFLYLKGISEQFTPGAPVVLFLDGRWRAYDAFPDSGTDRQDFWRLYAAEAYANGLFFAFHLKSAVGNTDKERTATQFGLMPLFETLAAFYRGHARFYHHAQPSPAAVSTSAPVELVMVAVRDLVGDQSAATTAGTAAHRLIHLVNHQYRPGAGGIVPQRDLVVTVSSERPPTTVSLASPDLLGDLENVAFTYANGQVSVTVPALDAYLVVVLTY